MHATTIGANQGKQPLHAMRATCSPPWSSPRPCCHLKPANKALSVHRQVVLCLLAPPTHTSTKIQVSQTPGKGCWPDPLRCSGCGWKKIEERAVHKERVPNKLKQQLCATNLMNCGGRPSAQMMHRIQNTNHTNLRGSNTHALGAHSQSGWPFLQEAPLLP